MTHLLHAELYILMLFKSFQPTHCLTVSRTIASAVFRLSQVQSAFLVQGVLQVKGHSGCGVTRSQTELSYSHHYIISLHLVKSFMDVESLGHTLSNAIDIIGSHSA